VHSIGARLFRGSLLSRGIGGIDATYGIFIIIIEGIYLPQFFWIICNLEAGSVGLISHHYCHPSELLITDMSSQLVTVIISCRTILMACFATKARVVDARA